jgi:stage II sporulation protein AA (anti-sigma F factor antagonist)
MEISCRKEGRATLITVTGKMDAVTAPDYEKSINGMIADGELSFVVDFDGLTYISSAGLRGILTTAKTLKSKGGQVLFANVTGTVKEVFDMSGFGSIFRMFPSTDAALAEIG